MSNEEIIGQLAASFGLANGAATKYGESMYDPATGTLYCEGITITKPTLEKALQYYRTQKESAKAMAERDAVFKDQYLFAVVACNAISMLEGNIKQK